MRAHRWRTLVLAGAALLAAGAARADDPAAAGVFRPPDTWQGGAATLTLGLDPDDEADTVLTHGFRHGFFHRGHFHRGHFHHGHFHFYRPSFALSFYRGFYPRYYGGFYGYPYYYPRYHSGLSFSFAIYPRYSYYPGFYSYPWYSYYPSYYYPRYSYYPSYGYYPGYSLSYYSYGYCPIGGTLGEAPAQTLELPRSPELARNPIEPYPADPSSSGLPEPRPYRTQPPPPVPAVPRTEPTPGAEPTFPYDGGPRDPVPMPRPETVPPAATAPAAGGLPVSLPAAPKTYRYPAYGESPPAPAGTTVRTGFRG